MSEWISVEDRLPEVGIDVLVWIKKGPGKKAAVTAGLFFDHGEGSPIWMGWESEEPFRHSWKITHWRPLPAPPSE